MNALDIHKILELLPHRYPFLLIDRVLNCEPGKTITALKNVTINEPFFIGHFPGYPVMPGVLIIEAMAQTAAILSFVTGDHKADDKFMYYFAGIDNARFKKPVTAGDQLILEAEIIRSLKGVWKFSARAKVEGQLVCEADLMCAIKQK